VSAPPEQVRVAIVDDHAMVRQALAAVLADNPRLTVVAQGEDTASAFDVLRDVVPDVLVLDYNLPGGGALSVLEEAERSGSPVRILILTLHENPLYAVRVLQAGANGFLLKSSAMEELLAAIDSVQKGEIFITPRLSRDVIDRLRRPPQTRTGIDSLSTREFELLRILGRGEGLKQAAAQLNIGVSTASTYRSRLLKKLELDSTSELIRFALENGLAE